MVAEDLEAVPVAGLWCKEHGAYCAHLASPRAAGLAIQREVAWRRKAGQSDAEVAAAVRELRAEFGLGEES